MTPPLSATAPWPVDAVPVLLTITPVALIRAAADANQAATEQPMDSTSKASQTLDKHNCVQGEPSAWQFAFPSRGGERMLAG